MLGPTLEIYNSNFLFVYLDFVILDPEKKSRNVGLYFCSSFSVFQLALQKV